MFFLIRLVFLPVRIALGLTTFTAKTGYRAGRLLGYRRLLVFGTGIAVGLLLAPVPGAQLRAKLQELLDQRGPVTDDDLVERVRFELSHSPRTWHLPQPEVAVSAGVAVLSGEAPHDTGRADLERAAAGVPGISAVENRLALAPQAAAGTNGAS
jgi:hypothetical protein